MAISPSQKPTGHSEHREASEKPAHKRKGIGFEVEEMMKLFLVIIIGLGVVILIIATSGSLSGMLSDFCNKNPTICGGNITPLQVATAQNSVNGLVKAINCVENQDDTCLSSDIKKMGFTGQATIEPIGDTTVTCKKSSNSYTCTVNNFQLPQKITDAQSWILGMGDPNFIVYYQSFPKEESDAWQISKSNFVALSIIGSGVLNAAFGGFGSVAKKVVTASKDALKSGAEKAFAAISEKMGRQATEDTLIVAAEKKLGSDISEQLFEQTFEKSVYDVFVKLSQEERDKMVSTLVQEYYKAYDVLPDKAVVANKLLKFVKDTPSDKLGWSADYLDQLSVENKGSLRKIYESFKDKLDALGISAGAPGSVTELRYGAVLATAYVAARADSVDEKFNSVGNAVALRTPFTTTTPFQLSKPIYIELKKGSTQYDTRFYLASPCRATLTVTKGTTTCWHSDASGSCQPGAATIKMGDNDVTVCEKSLFWCTVSNKLSVASFKEAYAWGDPNQQIYEAALVAENGEVTGYFAPSYVSGSSVDFKDVSSLDLYMEDVSSNNIVLKKCHDSQGTASCDLSPLSQGSEQTVISDLDKYLATAGLSSNETGTVTNVTRYTFSGIGGDAEKERFGNDMNLSFAGTSNDPIDAIQISAAPSPGGGSDYSMNYCYWGPNSGSTVIKYSALAAAIGIDVFGTAATGGVGAYFILGATGAGSALVEHVADSYSMWPSGGIG